MSTALQTQTDQSTNGQLLNSDHTKEIQTLSKPEEGFTNKADDFRKTYTKHNIFIDIDTLKPFEVRRMEKSKEYKHHRHFKKRKDIQINKSFTVKNSITSFRSLSPKISLKNQLYFRREPVVFAKVLTSSAPQGLKAKSDNKKEYKSRRGKRNQTRNRLNIKRKVLKQLQQLENDIKVVKAQIENDTKTIEDLQKQLLQKEKQRANLNLTIEKTTISSNAIIKTPTSKMLTKNLDNDRPTKYKYEDYEFNFNENIKELQQKYIQANSSDLHKLYKYRRHSNVTKRDNLKNTSKNININKMEGNVLNEDFYVDDVKKNENTRSST